MYIMWIVAAIGVIAAGVWVLFVIKRKKNRPINVISFSERSKAKSQSGQKCSYCKSVSKKLIFYAQDNGTVVGLCKDCRHKAESRDMLPL